MSKEKIINFLTKSIVIFIIGAIVGWCYELIFYYITEHRISLGTLYGPWLPIYGFGAVFISLLKPLKKHPIILFLGIILVTGILEYLSGYYIYNFMGERLWDYQNNFLNIGGFVCLRSVISFGIGGIFLTYVIVPLVEKIQNKKPLLFKIIAIILLLLFVSDAIFSHGKIKPYTY